MQSDQDTQQIIHLSEVDYQSMCPTLLIGSKEDQIQTKSKPSKETKGESNLKTNTQSHYDENKQKQRLIFKQKSKPSTISPFDKKFTRQHQNVHCYRKITQKNKRSTILEDSRQMEPYLSVSADFMKILLKKYELFKEKKLKETQMRTVPFSLGLQWKNTETQASLPLRIFIEQLLHTVWIEQQSQAIVWVVKMSIHHFEGYLKGLLQSSQTKLDPQHFFEAERLNSWYTLAHLHHKFRNFFFLIEASGRQSSCVNKLASYQCQNCQKKLNSICLCLNQSFCHDCQQVYKHENECSLASEYIMKIPNEKLTKFSQKGIVVLRNNVGDSAINTALQCLLSIQKLNNYFLSKTYLRDLNLGSYEGSFGQIPGRYAEIVFEAWHSRRLTVDSQQFLSSLKRHSLTFKGAPIKSSSYQYLMYLIDIMKQDLKTRTIAADRQQSDEKIQEDNENNIYQGASIIIDLFQSQIYQHVECQQCQYRQVKQRSTLSLELPILASTKVKKSIESCNCLFISMNTSEKNIYFRLELQEYTLRQLQDRTRSLLKLKPYRKIVFYIVSTHKKIKRVTPQVSILEQLKSTVEKGTELCCFEYTEKQLSGEFFQIGLTFQLKKQKQGFYENVSFKRPLFFETISKPQQGRDITRRILSYLYPRVYSNQKSICQAAYLQRYMDRIPFRLFLSTPFTNNQMLEIRPDEEIRLSYQHTQVIARFDNQHQFRLSELETTKKITEVYQRQSQKSRTIDVIVEEHPQLLDCIKKMKQKQIVRDSMCKNCSAISKQLRSIFLGQTTKILILYLKNGSLKPSYKQHPERIDFPFVLDLTHQLQYKQVTSVSQDRIKIQYRLIAVANRQVNQESLTSAFVLHNHRWIEFNDHNISQISSDKVCSPSAEYLIYQKIQ